MRLAHLLPVGFVVCVGVGGGLGSAAEADDRRPAPEGASPAWHSIQLPITIGQLAAAAGLPEPAAPELFLYDLIRVVHERLVDVHRSPGSPLAAAISAMRNAGPGAAAVVPLPLTPGTWARAVFGRPIAPGALAEAILDDRRASLLYVGLGALDEETLEVLERAPTLVATLARDHAAALAAFGRSVSIHDGAVRVPLPGESRAAWEALVGAPVTDPPRFLPLLLGRDHGRLAYLFDVLTQLDEPHRRFAMGLPVPPDQSDSRDDGEGSAGSADRTDATAALLAAYQPVRTASPEWLADVHPFYRPAFDLVDALRGLRVTADGRLRGPASRDVWARVFGRRTVLPARTPRTPGPSDIDAPWLLSQWLGASPRVASVRLGQIRLAQRLFGDGPASASAALEAAIDAAARYPALTLTLERLGFSEPAEYSAAAVVAAAVTSRASPRDGFATLSLFQGLLALVERARWAGSLDRDRAQALARSLLGRHPSSGVDYEAELIGWLSGTLLPALGAATGMEAASGPERVVLAALAGVRRGASSEAPALVAWEGGAYRLDVGAGTLARLQKCRELVVSPSLAQALTLHQATEAVLRPHVSPEAVARMAAQLAGLGGVLPDEGETAELRRSFERASRAVGRMRSGAAGPRPPAGMRRDLAALRNLVAADVLRWLVYVPSLGDPDGPVRLGGQVARRHRFDVPDPSNDAAEPAWSLPRELVTADGGWHVRGSLLELDVALARLALRRLDLDRIPLDPRLDDDARRRFAIAVALTRPDDLGDASRDRLAGALAAGRSRVTAATKEPGGLASIASAAGLDARRSQALRWAFEATSTDPATRLSLGELARLGAGDLPVFTFSTVPDAGCLAAAEVCGANLSDLAIRLIDGLATRGLPAALLPGMLAPATQDLLDDAQALHSSDQQTIWRFVRELPESRIDDYVSALVGGALLPAGTRSPTGSRR